MSAPGSTLVKIRSRLSGSLIDAAWLLGLNRSGFAKAKGSRILVYHGICQDDPLRYNTLFLKLKVFEQQLRLFKKYFQVVSLEDYYNQRYDASRFALCLTFDDGFANNYKYVLTILEQYRLPAAFFVTGIREAGYDILWNDVLCMAQRHGPAEFFFQNEVYAKGKDKKYIALSSGQKLADVLRATGFNEKAEMIDRLGYCRKKAAIDYWQQMTKEELRALSLSKWATIGSHGYYHNDLARISPDSVKTEVVGVKKYLEAVIDKEVKAIAFPYGSYNDKVVTITKEAGYDRLLTTGLAREADMTLRARLTINPFISTINQLHAGIVGKYD